MGFVKMWSFRQVLSPQRFCRYTLSLAVSGGASDGTVAVLLASAINTYLGSTGRPFTPIDPFGGCWAEVVLFVFQS